MLFSDFASKILFPLESTTKKLEQTAILAGELKLLPADDVPMALFLMLGQLAPVYRNPKFQFGIEFLLSALAVVKLKNAGQEVAASESTDLFGAAGLPELGQERRAAKDELKKMYKQVGDIGLVAESLGTQDSRMSVEDVYQELWQLTQISGEGSQEEKIAFVAALLQRVDALSARYVCRMIAGDIRLGVSEKTILDALSWAMVGDKSLRERIDQIYQRHPDIGAIAKTILSDGLEAAEKLDAEIGTPILPALCDRLKTTAEMIAKMGEVIAEPKYDGTRVQIHFDRATKKLHTFTRNLEESSHLFPELLDWLMDLDVDSVIFDSEAVGYDPETHALLAFQDTIKRKRKHGIAEMSAKIPLRFFLFDVLYLNGKSLLREPLSNRKNILNEVLKNAHESLVVAPTLVTSDAEALHEFHVAQLAAGLEGIVVKQRESHYQSGRQAFTWVKLKEAEDTSGKLSDTIDAVILGYYYGRGKRTQFGIGAFLVGVLDEEKNQIVTIAKVGTGLTDEEWRETRARCDAARAEGSSAENSGYSLLIPELLQPDVLVPPKVVVEIAADEITRSPVHTAGVALRFPRLVRFRDDKSVAQVTTTKELSSIIVA